MAIRMGVHLWSFAGCTVAEAAAITRALGLAYLDLGSTADFDVPYMVRHDIQEVERLNAIRQQTGVNFVDCFPQVSENGTPFTNNHPDATIRGRYRALWQAFFPIAAAIGLEGITLSPGRYWPGESPRTSFDRAAEELRWAVAAGAGHNLRVRIEPHIESVTWQPELVLEMVDAVPGLTLTVDHSHFIFHALPYEQIAVMHLHGSHWHLRQARPGEAQSKGSDGQIDFARIVRDLRADGYDGGVTLEYVHGAWMRQDNVDCLPETIALRNEIRGYLE